MSTHRYFPFGEEINEITTQTSHNTHQYTGHERDRETKLDYMLARYYEPGVGRFISTDPVAKLGRNLLSPQRWNRYTYALNNPIKFLDPDGRDVTLYGAARDVAKSAYMNSGSFRPEFDAAKNNPNVHVTMRLTGPSQSSREGIGNLVVTTTKTPEGGTVRKVDGPVAVETAGKGEAQSGAVMGHELKHINNLADPNKRPAGTVKDEQKLGEPEADEVQKNVKDDYQDKSDDVTDAQAETALEGTEPKKPEKKK